MEDLAMEYHKVPQVYNYYDFQLSKVREKFGGKVHFWH